MYTTTMHGTTGSNGCFRLVAPIALAVLVLALLQMFPAATTAQAELTITVGEPFTLFRNENHHSWGPWNYPELRKCGDGSLLLWFSTGPDRFMPPQEAPSLYRSLDQGETWELDPMATHEYLSPRMRATFTEHNNGAEPLTGMMMNGFCNLSDGTSITYYYHTMVDGAPPNFIDSMWKSQNGGTTWAGPDDIDLNVPGNVADSLGRGPALWRRSVQLANGDLVTTAHTYFDGDSKLRVIALGSSDKGLNWEYLSTVAYNPSLPTEGFTEPIICKLADEELICFMRTNGNQPMYQSYSSNGGETWTEPVQSGVDGVAPDMRLLSNGVLACSYGRPGNNIMFSEDGDGREWTDHTAIIGGYGTGYTSFEEVSPGRLLFVFDAINYQGANCIRGVYIDVVPEPSVLVLLLGMGLIGLLAVARRRR